MGMALGFGEAGVRWGCGMNDAALDSLDGVEGEPRGCGMNVGAVAERLSGGVENDVGDIVARRGTGATIFGGVGDEIGRESIDGEADRRRGMADGSVLPRLDFSWGNVKLVSSSESSTGSKMLSDFLANWKVGDVGEAMERSETLALVSASESKKYSGGGLNVNLIPPSSTSPTNSSSMS